MDININQELPVLLSAIESMLKTRDRYIQAFLTEKARGVQSVTSNPEGDPLFIIYKERTEKIRKILSLLKEAGKIIYEHNAL